MPLLTQFFLADSVFWQLVISGLATGSVYALLALAIVLVYRTTRVVNLAQGEMAMFCTFVAWSLLHRFDYWLVFVITVLIGAVMGALLERTLIRPVEKANPLVILVVTLALFSVFNGGAIFLWGKTTGGALFPTVVPGNPVVKMDGVRIGAHSLAIMGITVVVMALLYLFFRYTKPGLALRAVADSPEASRLVGIRVAQMLMLGWALSAAVGALAGILIAPLISTSAPLMLGVLIFALAAVVVGGLDSAPGVVLAGLMLGVSQNLYLRYTPGEYLGSGTELLFALVLILAVLLVRPQGLLGSRRVKRV